LALMVAPMSAVAQASAGHAEPTSASPLDVRLPPAGNAAPKGASITRTSAGQAAGATQTSDAVRIAIIVTLLTLIPAMAMCMTPFVRIIVALSMIRHAFGMPETPPNQVLVILALFLTGFVMTPTLTQVNDNALQPFLNGSISMRQAFAEGSGPMRTFMLRQVHDKDLATVYEIAKQPLPNRAADVGLMQLTSAFMLNELRVAFKIGFVIMLPFLLIDLVVSTVLLSLGMIMVPPTTLSLPIKVLMFVLIDGWSLILQGVVGSFR
jgi:flagellar biosynthetic protein FliP